MNLPKSIRVGYKTFTVEDWPAHLAHAHDSFGECDKDNGIIKVRSDLDSVEVCNTLLHEIIHAAWWIGNIGKEPSEERAVTVLANQLTQIWRDNPDLIAFMSEALSA